MQPHGCARPQPRSWAAAAGGGSGADNWVAKPRGVLTSGAGTYQTFTIARRYTAAFFSLRPSDAGCELRWMFIYDLGCI